ncbi:MAG: hypothetical protein K6T61_15060 [Bryobacteraceae bacterium]|nr:hypothetical protein [Bryobacteraceae bacterium]
MKKMIVALLACALTVSVGFAQQTKGKGAARREAAQTATTASAKPVRHTVKLDSLPVATQDAIKKAIGAGKLTRLVSITEDGKTTYEAQVVSGKQKSMMKFDANGNPIQ